MKKPKIVIHVRGGVIQSVHANRSILYVIVDEDEPIAGGEKISDVYGEDSIFNENNFDVFDSYDNVIIGDKFLNTDDTDNSHHNIEDAKNVLIQNGYVRHFWCEEDIKSHAENFMDIELTDNQVNDVMCELENIDCNIGINWDSIQCAIYEVIENNNEDEDEE